MAHTYLAHGPYFKLHLTPLISNILQLYLMACNVLDFFLCCALEYCMFCVVLFSLKSPVLQGNYYASFYFFKLLLIQLLSEIAHHRCDNLPHLLSIQGHCLHDLLLSQDFFNLLFFRYGSFLFLFLLFLLHLVHISIIVSDLTFPSLSYLVNKIQRVNQNNF